MVEWWSNVAVFFLKINTVNKWYIPCANQDCYKWQRDHIAGVKV